MDINILTKLITTFRAETKENAISPEVLGALLQRIADILGNAAEKTDFYSILVTLILLLMLSSLQSIYNLKNIRIFAVNLAK